MANNADIGTVKCAHCGNLAIVRCNVKSKLYYLCQPSETHQGCGLIPLGYDGGQAWIKANAEFYPGFEHYANQGGQVDQVDQVDIEEIVEVKKKTSKADRVAADLPELDQAALAECDREMEAEAAIEDVDQEGDFEKPGFFDRPLF